MDGKDEVMGWDDPADEDETWLDDEVEEGLDNEAVVIQRMAARAVKRARGMWGSNLDEGRLVRLLTEAYALGNGKYTVELAAQWGEREFSQWHPSVGGAGW